MDQVRQLLSEARVLYADETPARCDGKPRYVHIACTEFLTALHTGGRSAEDIDAGGVLPGRARLLRWVVCQGRLTLEAGAGTIGRG